MENDKGQHDSRRAVTFGGLLQVLKIYSQMKVISTGRQFLSFFSNDVTRRSASE